MSNKTIALVGNQNCGKTTIFNMLTGSNQYVGNWPGVTVDQVIGKISDMDWDIVDLPGLYSLSPYSAEEIVSRDFLLSDEYDVILNVVDATHLDRSLSLTLEVAPMGKPMVIALNMMDLLKKNRTDLDIKKMSELLGVEIIPVSGISGEGLSELKAAIERARSTSSALDRMLPEKAEKIISQIGSHLDTDNEGRRYFITKSLLQGDKLYLKKYETAESLLVEVSRGRAEILSDFNTDAESFFPMIRYSFIDKILSECRRNEHNRIAEISKKIDNVVTNPWMGLPIFFAVIFFIYYVAVVTLGTMATDYANDVIFGEWCTEGAEYLLEQAEAPEWLSSLVIDGVVGGVGAVLGFVPQMIVLFFLLSIVEQCGYMTRVAFMLDRIFRHFGLSGRSVFPILVATGCAVPALMSTKSIDNINEQRITLITSSFMPCSAKLPIMVMIFAAFFRDEAAFIAPLVYFMAIFSIAVTGFILKKSQAFNEEVSPFVMELPDYHTPSVRNVVLTTYDRCKAFVIKAGTIIFATVVVIWFLANFGFGEEGFGMVETDASMLAAVGSAIAFIFAPLGFASWQASVAVITGLLAKENVVGTLATLLNLSDEDVESVGDSMEAVAEVSAPMVDALHGIFPLAVAAFAYLAFNLWSTPCVAALGAMRRQFGSRRWFGFAVTYMLVYAYCLALVIYQIGGLVLGVVEFNVFTVVAFIIVAAFIYLLLKPNQNNRVSLKIPAKNI